MRVPHALRRSRVDLREERQHALGRRAATPSPGSVPSGGSRARRGREGVLRARRRGAARERLGDHGVAILESIGRGLDRAPCGLEHERVLRGDREEECGDHGASLSPPPLRVGGVAITRDTLANRRGALTGIVGLRPLHPDEPRVVRYAGAVDGTQGTREPVTDPAPTRRMPFGARSSRRRRLVLVLAILASPVRGRGAPAVLPLHRVGARAGACGAGLRGPGLYADQRIDDEYWILRRRFLDDAAMRVQRANYPDPLLGWRSASDRGRHVSARIRRSRRRAAPVDPRRRILRGRLEHQIRECELGEEWRFLNYAVGGFGIDQSLLLLRELLPEQLATRRSGECRS